MKKQSLIFLLVIIIAACNNNDQNAGSDNPSDSLVIVPDSNKTEEPVALTECYEQISEKDTVMLQVVTKGGDISGKLTYKLEEKDVNEGNISGKMNGDTLIALYKFKSEGVISEREVAFLKTAKGYIEGFGEPIDSNGVMKIRKDKPVNFSDSLLLKKINCN